MQYFWTGSNWSTIVSEAKRFDTDSAARAEMTAYSIVYTYTVNRV